mgnify:FL=1
MQMRSSEKRDSQRRVTTKVAQPYKKYRLWTGAEVAADPEGVIEINGTQTAVTHLLKIGAAEEVPDAGDNVIIASWMQSGSKHRMLGNGAIELEGDKGWVAYARFDGLARAITQLISENAKLKVQASQIGRAHV